MRRTRVAIISVATLILISFSVIGLALASSSRADSAAACSGANEPVGGAPIPQGSPASDSSTLADWSGQSAAITSTGAFSWTSSPLTVSSVPNAFVFDTLVVGGQATTTTTTPISITPVDLGAGNTPGSHVVELTTTFNVACISGAPELLLWEARAESTEPTPPG